MRYATLLALPATVISIATAFQLPDFQPFLAALPVSLSDYIPPSVSNQTAQHELLKRQANGGCATGLENCSNLGDPGACCVTGAVCSPDALGHVACCPSGKACSGTVSGVVTAGTLNSDGSLVGAATTGTDTSGLVAATTMTTSNGLVLASTTTAGTGSDFVLASGTTVATPGAGARAAQIVSLLRRMQCST